MRSLQAPGTTKSPARTASAKSRSRIRAKSGEVWIDGEGTSPFSSAACTLGAYADFRAKGKKINVTYVFDTTRGIKLFADQAFFAVDKGNIAPFLLKKDAEEYAAKNNGKVVGFEDAVKSIVSGGKT
jgi:NitT/TauT family transport system substrate-binding protein